MPNLVFFREPNYVCIEKWLAPAASAKTFLGNNDGNVKPIKLFHNINDEYCHKSKHIFYGFWAAAPKGMKSCRTQGDFCSFVCPSIRTCIPPPWGSNPGLKAQIPASRLKSAHADGQTDEQKSPCVLQDIVSFRGAAQKRKIPNKYHGKLPQIYPFRTNGNSPLCPTGHWPFGAAALLSLYFFR